MFFSTFFDSVASATARNRAGWIVRVSAGFVDVPRAPESRLDAAAARLRRKSVGSRANREPLPHTDYGCPDGGFWRKSAKFGQENFENQKKNGEKNKILKIRSVSFEKHVPA